MLGEGMKSKSLILVGASALSFGTGAVAAETEATVVLVHYSVRENDPEKLVEIVLNPIERSLQKLNRVVEVKSTVSHGVVNVEIGFEGTLTTQDLAAVTARIEMLKLDESLVVLSRVIEMRQPRF
jgi:multidrug efflux pump subunit AcrB